MGGVEGGRSVSVSACGAREEKAERGGKGDEGWPWGWEQHAPLVLGKLGRDGLVGREGAKEGVEAVVAVLGETLPLDLLPGGLGVLGRDEGHGGVGAEQGGRGRGGEGAAGRGEGSGSGVR